MPVDYTALAEQARKTAPPSVDYAALAEQARQPAKPATIPGATPEARRQYLISHPEESKANRAAGSAPFEQKPSDESAASRFTSGLVSPITGPAREIWQFVTDHDAWVKQHAGMGGATGDLLSLPLAPQAAQAATGDVAGAIGSTAGQAGITALQAKAVGPRLIDEPGAPGSPAIVQAAKGATGAAASSAAPVIAGAAKGAVKAIPHAIETSVLKYTGVPQILRGAVTGAKSAIAERVARAAARVEQPSGFGVARGSTAEPVVATAPIPAGYQPPVSGALPGTELPPSPLPPRVSLAEQYGLQPGYRQIPDLTPIPGQLPSGRVVGPAPAPATLPKGSPQITAAEVAQSMGGMSPRQFASLPADHPQRVAAQRTADAINKDLAAKAAAASATQVETPATPVEPVAAPPEQPVVEQPQPASSAEKPTVEQLSADLAAAMKESGSYPPTPGEPAQPVPQGPLDAGMQAMPGELRRPMAKANYRAAATGAEAIPGGQVYEAAGRTNRVDKFAPKLMEMGKTSANVTKADFTKAASELGINPPSQATFEQTVAAMKKAESAAVSPDAAQSLAKALNGEGITAAEAKAEMTGAHWKVMGERVGMKGAPNAGLIQETLRNMRNLEKPGPRAVSPPKPVRGTGQKPLASKPATVEAPVSHEAEAVALPKVGTHVDGLKVRKDVPNTDSIGSTFENYETLPGVREFPMKGFESQGKSPYGFYSSSDVSRVERLSDQIGQSGEISPLIVAIGPDGPYVLEGGHRISALAKLGKKSFPAKVVIDRDSIPASPNPAAPKPAAPKVKGKAK